jgi:predicted transcriptional regulator
MSEKMAGYERKPDPKLPDNHVAVYSYIMKYGPVKSADLERMFGIGGAQVREIVRHYRREGELIISGSQGYCVALDWKEFITAMHHLESRALDMLETMSLLRKKYEKPGQIGLF